MELRRPTLALSLVVGLAACAASPVTPRLPDAPLLEGDATVDARALAARAPLTVLVFFSPSCHCLDQHGDRFRDLAEAYRPRGVQVVMVDSNVRATREGDLEEARRRGYPFPIVLDRGARLANALGAESATYSVIVDGSGRVRYRGGFDSDKTHLRDDATPYVRDALDDLLAGREPRVPEAKALGCALEKW